MMPTGRQDAHICARYYRSGCKILGGMVIFTRPANQEAQLEFYIANDTI